MTVDLDVLVLPAFDDLPGLPGEVAPWRSAYEFTDELSIPGVPEPVLVTDHGLGLVPTGLGKVAAATTTTALCRADAIDLDDALVCSVGVAGAPPDLPIGSVVLSESIVDWDDKCRLDPPEQPWEVPAEALSTNPYTEGQGVFDLSDSLVSWAGECAAAASLVDTTLDDRSPTVTTGTNLCGDELWHGEQMAEQAAWVCEQAGAASYLVTEMEDAGTAGALDRFGALDRYLSVRGVSNHDRPLDGTDARENFFGPAFEEGFGVGVQNAVTVARSIVDERLR